MATMTYIGNAAIEAKALTAVIQAVGEAAEDLTGKCQAAAPVDEGTLRASIHTDGVRVAGKSATARVQTGGEASGYAVHVHEGTAAHHIIATAAQALYWPGAAHPVEAVVHPGTAPNKYIEGPLLANAALYRTFLSRAAASVF